MHPFEGPAFPANVRTMATSDYLAGTMMILAVACGGAAVSGSADDGSRTDDPGSSSPQPDGSSDEGSTTPEDGGSLAVDTGAPSPVEAPEVDVHRRPQEHTSTVLFDHRTDQLNVGYHSFRIPSIATTTKGTLLAFVEGRQCGEEDFGNINLVYKRSVDGGKTWSPLKEVVGTGAGTWGNPTAVVDASTGRIFLFLSFNAENKSQFGGANPCTGQETTIVAAGERPVFVTHSDDDGLTWTKPQNVTATTQPKGKAWDAVGPGVGIQTATGRLVIPAIERNIYSDDHGETWTFAAIPGGTSEATVVERSDGKLLRNDRAVGSVYAKAARRWVSVGTIPGGFAEFTPHDELLDPRVEGSSIRYSANRHRILFLNPASTVGRCKMRVRASYDDGKTWPVSRQLHDTLTADQTCDQRIGGYSSMTKTADQHVGALSERDVTTGHKGVEFHRFNLSWLVDGKPEPK